MSQLGLPLEGREHLTLTVTGGSFLQLYSDSQWIFGSSLRGDEGVLLQLSQQRS